MKTRIGAERRTFQVVRKRRIVHTARPPAWRSRAANDEAQDLSALVLYGQA